MQVKVKLMPKIDEYEIEILSAFEKGRLKFVASKAELAKFKAAAWATAVKDRRVNIRLSSEDLSEIRCYWPGPVTTYEISHAFFSEFREG